MKDILANSVPAEDLERTKTDAIDALGIARFAAQKRPASTRLPDAVTEENRREAFQAIAPETEAGLFLVPKVIE